MCKQKTNERLWLEEWLSEYYHNEEYEIVPCFSYNHIGSLDDEFKTDFTNFQPNVIYFGQVSGSDEAILTIKPFGSDSLIEIPYNSPFVEFKQSVLFHYVRFAFWNFFTGYKVIFKNQVFYKPGK